MTKAVMSSVEAGCAEVPSSAGETVMRQLPSVSMPRAYITKSWAALVYLKQCINVKKKNDTAPNWRARRKKLSRRELLSYRFK